jgi:hypothetical protein
MAYHYTEFDGVPLPIYNPSQDHSSTEVQSSLVRSAGGLFDHYGSRRRRGQGLRVQMTGLYIGMPTGTFLVDHLGSFIVDHGGNFLTTGNEGADLRAQINALRSKVGMQGTLWRSLLGTTSRHWITARLLRVGWPQEVSDRLWKAQLTCEFESIMEGWRAATQTATIATLTTFEGPRALTVMVQSLATIEDAILTIVADATITSVRVRSTPLGVDWTWTGTLAAGSTLTIDAGAQTVRRDGVDAYSGFALAAAHTAQAWLPLAPGVNLYTVTANGLGTATLRHYDQWL